MVDGWLIFLMLLAAYMLIVLALVNTGLFRRWNLSLFLGVALMIKTKRGPGVMSWFAQARGFFDRSATFGLFLTGFSMALLVGLLLISLPLILRVSPEQAPSPQLILAIPGINPILPLGFGITALVFAIVVHEFSHGIMARVYDMKVKSMGILLLIVPIGAFVEPDEEELRRAPRLQRAKVFSAGPLSNLVFALVFGLVFSSVLIANAAPVAGVPMTAVTVDGPLHAAGVQPGGIITSVNGTAVSCLSDFRDVMGNATRDVRPNTTIEVLVRPTAQEPAVAYSVTTGRRADFPVDDAQRDAFANDTDAANETILGFEAFPSCRWHELLAKPLASLPGTILLIQLPLRALTGDFPLVAPFTGFFVTPFAPDVFWFFVGLSYWLFWLNLMVGLTNTLPMLPMDGGHMFRDFVDGFIEKVRPALAAEQRQAAAGRVSLIVTLGLLGIILLQFMGPAIIAFFS